jgi:hypothetical protein
VLNIRIVGVLAIAIGLLIGCTWRQADLFAVGCDAFGYARQAELLRDKGLPDGLDTRIDVEEARFLTGIAKAITPDSTQYFEAIAPHCHHYNARVDRIILQYPPGTGLVLAIFPENVSLGLAFILAMTLIAGVFTIAMLRARPTALSLAIACAALAFIEIIMARPAALDSASIAMSAALIPLCAFLAAVAFPPQDDDVSWTAALFLGLAAGFLVTLRLPNIFPLAGLACTIAINRRLWRPSEIGSSLAALIAALIGAGAGLAPLLAANGFNAGSPLATTYSPIDAAPPVLTRDLLLQNLAYYFGSGFAAPVVIVALAALILRGLVLWRWPKAGVGFGPILGAAVCYFLSLTYFCTHTIQIPYYMFPASLMTLCLLVFDMLAVQPGGVAGMNRFDAGCVVAALAIFVVVRCAFVAPRPHWAVLPDEVRAKEAIVWADMTNGTAFYYDHKYAAKLNFTSNCMQDALLRAIAARGRPQYFIEDSADMSEIVRRFAKSVPLQKIGVFDNNYQKSPIWKLDQNAHWTGMPCNPTK